MADLNNYYSNGSSPIAGLLAGLTEGTQIGMQMRQLQNQEEQTKRANELATLSHLESMMGKVKDPKTKNMLFQQYIDAGKKAGLFPDNISAVYDGSPEAKSAIGVAIDAGKLHDEGKIDFQQRQDMVMKALTDTSPDMKPNEQTKFLDESVNKPAAMSLLTKGPQTSQGLLQTLPQRDVAYGTPEAKQGIADYAANPQIQQEVKSQAMNISPDAVKEYGEINKSNTPTPTADLKGFAEYLFNGDVKKAQDSLTTPEGKKAYDDYRVLSNKQKYEYRYPTKVFGPGQLPPSFVGDRRTGEITYKGNPLPANADLEYISAQYKSDKGSLTALQKGSDTINMFEKGVQNSLNLVDKLSDAYGRGAFPKANSWQQIFQYHAGDPRLKPFQNALTTAMTEYMKVTTAGTNITATELSVAAQERAKKLLETSDNPQTIKAALNVMKQEMIIKKNAFADQLGEIQGRIKSGYIDKVESSTPQIETTTSNPSNRPLPTF